MMSKSIFPIVFFFAFSVIAVKDPGDLEAGGELEEISATEPLIDKEINIECNNLIEHLNAINKNYIKLSKKEFSNDEEWLNELAQELGDSFLTFETFFKSFKEHLAHEKISVDEYRKKWAKLSGGVFCLGSIGAGVVLGSSVVLAMVGGVLQTLRISCLDWHCPDGLHKVDTTPWACYSGPTDKQCAQLYLQQFPAGARVSPDQVIYMTDCGDGWTPANVGIIPHEDYIYDRDEDCEFNVGVYSFVPAEAAVALAGGIQLITVAASGGLLLYGMCGGAQHAAFTIDENTEAILRKVQEIFTVPQEIKDWITQAFVRSGGVEAKFYTDINDPLLDEKLEQNHPGKIHRIWNWIWRKS